MYVFSVSGMREVSEMTRTEDEIFARTKWDPAKAAEYGFARNGENYRLARDIGGTGLRAEIEIDAGGKVRGCVLDPATGDEYTAFRRENAEGSFVGEVREGYRAVLEEIRDACFVPRYFIGDQANRVADALRDRYGDEPDFPWEKYPGYGVFRNPANEKWYGLIMDIDRSKLHDGTGACEVIDVKADPERIPHLTERAGIYPAYHMNKKYWISVILDDTLPDEEIFELVRASHTYTEPKRNIARRAT